MTVKFNIALSDQLNEEIEAVVRKTENTKSDVLRKALSLYLAAQQGKEKGLGIGLIDPQTNQVKTEIVGI